ncbi:hypothetical protein MRX96_030077 [Rhipicephalus microplus]
MEEGRRPSRRDKVLPARAHPLSRSLPTWRPISGGARQRVGWSQDPGVRRSLGGRFHVQAFSPFRPRALSSSPTAGSRIRHVSRPRLALQTRASSRTLGVVGV